MHFRHERVDSNPPSGRLGSCSTSDLTGNGLPDVIIGGLGDPVNISFMGRSVALRTRMGIGSLIKWLETNLFWYENPGWKRHDMSDSPPLDVSATLGDVTDNRRQDFISGQGLDHQDLYWFEQPEDPRQSWTRRLITDAFEKYHDVAFGDVDNDGKPEVVGLSQESEVIFYYKIPDNPLGSPWPESGRHIIAEEIDVEGVKIVDIDGDGEQELLAGPNVFTQPDDPAEPWERECIAPGWEWTRIAVADVDEDGALEVVLAEGDRPYADGQPGRVAWFDPPDWTPHPLDTDLFCPHSLQVTDFTGSGTMDIYVAEMGLGINKDPEHFVFRNLGGGEFERELIFSGIPTHEAKAVDLTNNGRPDLVGKSYTPDHHVDIWYNER